MILQTKILFWAMLALFLTVLASVNVAHAEGDVLDIPGMTVTGSKYRTPRGLMMMLNIDLHIDISPPYEAPTIEHEGGRSEEDIDAQRCELLREQKPQNCGILLGGNLFFNKPSVPDFDPNWSGNGCGTGGATNIFLSFISGQLFDDFFELNEPYEGVSFLDACNNHDRCFASVGSSFNQCNADFFSEMASACGQIDRCNDFASAYRTAVASDQGRNIFNNVQADVTCAEWHDLMEINECPDDS